MISIRTKRFFLFRLYLKHVRRLIEGLDKDFGVDIFENIAGSLVGMNESSLKKACRRIELESEEFVVLNDFYDEMFLE